MEGEAFLKQCLGTRLNLVDRETLEAYMDKYQAFKAGAKVPISLLVFILILRIGRFINLSRISDMMFNLAMKALDG